MAMPRYTPAEFVALVKSQPNTGKIKKPEEAMLYGMALGRISNQNRTDGKISHKQAERLVAVYNAHVEQFK